MSAYRWKSFHEDEDRPEKPRRFGVTEMRGPHYTLLTQNVLQVEETYFRFVFLWFDPSSAWLLRKCGNGKD
ncbi:Protein heat stress associated 32 [Vitis vinifera]|uniref:Protein HEAT-STRESS-ASSOCIATED 32 n=1 Tax=Vitis vinifera TaxID=29760 RepID=A0A438HPR3_VITVI|nr:Protein heat-stress-associated 32 [Vitis vinifera]RVW86430.1 Protein heat stress associated 32 [Vitis vinifera]